MLVIYNKTKNFFLDLLFPRYCIDCGAEGDWICGECLKKIDIIKQPFCPQCRRATKMGEFCDICKGGVTPPLLDGIIICANFDEGILREAIHIFKYNRVFDIGKILGQIMAGKLKSIPVGAGFKPAPTFDLIIPVPLHKKRKAWRGFNQAEILGRELTYQLKTNDQELDKIIFRKDILIRKRYTIPQAELDREERLNNLKDVFVVGNGHAYSLSNENSSIRNSPSTTAGRHGCSLQNTNILLIDDITTTGATLEECAKVLKNNGAKSVWGIVLAKGK